MLCALPLRETVSGWLWPGAAGPAPRTRVAVRMRGAHVEFLMRVAGSHFRGRVNQAARALVAHAMAGGGRRAAGGCGGLPGGDASDASEGSDASDASDEEDVGEWSGLVAGEHDWTLFTLQLGTLQYEWLCACADMGGEKRGRRLSGALEPVVRNPGVDVVLSRVMGSYERMDAGKLRALLERLAEDDGAAGAPRVRVVASN